MRIGNNAVGQRQLDVYGEVMNALHLARVGGLQADDTAWNVQRALLTHLDTIWQEPDEGIWETRGGRQHFTFSKVMAWVAYDRAIRSAEMFKLEGPLDEWRATRATSTPKSARRLESRAERVLPVLRQRSARCERPADAAGRFPAADGSARQRHGGRDRKRICMHDGFVMRYRTTEYDDGLPPAKAPSSRARSGWWTTSRCKAASMKPSRCIERLLGLCNDVGLLAEEYDPTSETAGR